MNRKATERVHRALFFVLVILLTGIAAGCTRLAPRLYTPMQPDGWSAQPIAITCRFAPDADLDPATRTPMGDEGYYLYLLTDVARKRDYNGTLAFYFSYVKNPIGHSWLILESPQNRLECGQTGNLGREKQRYEEGVKQRLRDHDPNPIAYLWEMMSDGQFVVGKPKRTPTFVWRMPITKRRHQLIHEYLMGRKYDQFGVRANNCVDLVTDAAALAGINLIHRTRVTYPAEKRILGRTLRAWTDPQYGALEFSTPEVLEMDLRQLAQFGIGRDTTGWYLTLKH